MRLENLNLAITIEHLPYFNYTFCLNKYAFLERIVLENLHVEESTVKLVVTSSLGIFEPLTLYIDKVGVERLSLSRFDFQYDYSFLKSLSEKELDSITVQVYVGEEEMGRKLFQLDVLPFDYFGGLLVMPQLLSSYIFPNHPVVYEVKSAAVQILEENGLKASFEGYQSNDKERVLQVVSALYKAIQNKQLVYSAMPASVEQSGQRIRLIDQVWSTSFGNCIDISLLFAACLEAIDLHPIIVITEGHAFIGVWLEDQRFDTMINLDQTAISKRIANGMKDIVLIETTRLCRPSTTSFSHAIHSAEVELMKEERFIMSIDVSNCRANGVVPLAIGKGDSFDVHGVDDLDSDSEMDLDYTLGESYESLDLLDNNQLSKQKIWERKLLDLSLRNNLLNIRFSKSMLQLVDVDIDQLENALADGKQFSIHPDNKQVITKKYNQYIGPVHPSLPLYQLANEEFTYNRLLTGFHADDLETILTHTYRQAKLAEEENGKSTLYLGVGLLKWYEPKNTLQARLAPILLIPVELSRKSVNSKFTLRSREEETMINITLVEYLKQEFKLNIQGLEQLPMDGQGVDVNKVLAIVRHAVLNLPGWDVLSQVVLGNFSFNKLILWQDISKFSAEIEKSAIVKSLIDGHLTSSMNSVERKDSELESLSSAALTLPIPVDNSQLNAVLDAHASKTFILHGPPGTGKSQTITNIIANSLANGKKVLFVAAKKAALDVVHKRLDQIGLGAFTLELHSNKSKKSDVLQQFERVLEMPKYQIKRDFEQEGQRLDQQRKELSQYIAALHEENAIGWSLYDSISYLEYHQIPYDENYRVSIKVNNLNQEVWINWLDWLTPFSAVVSKIGLPSKHPLRSIKLNYHQFEHKNLLLAAIDTYLSEKEDARLLLEKYKIEEGRLNSYLPVLEFIRGNNLNPNLIKYAYHTEELKDFQQWLTVLTEWYQVEDAILQMYNKQLLEIDLSALQFTWNQAKHSWFLPKWLKQRKVKSQLQGYAYQKVQGELAIDQLFSHIENYKMLGKQLLKGQFHAISTLFVKDATNSRYPVEQIAQEFQAIQQLVNILEESGVPQTQTWLEHNLLTVHIPDQIDALLSSVERLQKARKALLSYVYMIGDTETLLSIKNHIAHLEDWINYNIYKERGETLALTWFIDKLEAGQLDNYHLEEEFQKIFRLNHFIQVLNEKEVLNSFDAGIYQSLIKKYKDLHKDFVELSKHQLVMKLSANIPNFNREAAQSSEVGIIQKAIRSKGRGISIRRLFDQIPTLLPRLKPCMLMSPISVAQYFDVDQEHFDLVIFDEASQLPTAEAISALARAKQAIIVGDPKQMPPTNFFSSTKVDEEQLELEDLESILDDCLALSIPSNYLLRHYRSKHESLIAFSNVNFYEGKLMTFPSPDDLNQKVTFEYVAGFYDKGKSRTNRNEAQAIIDYIKRHLLKKDKKSIGVVTFSQTQQSLIEDLLQKLYQTNPEIEEYAMQAEEPIFIKNLENVQGDERDIILFSVGYGPDEYGRVSMNFGPLNRDGGWRRLNVAVTRARYEMKIFSSLRGDQIDLNRSKAEGVKGLKDFLSFAEKGNYVLNLPTPNHAHETLVDAIHNELKNNGLIVKKYIGTSSYKVDLGIVHPHSEKEYILGILVDGDNYEQIHTTNDRELLTPSVLKGLGWNIYRIWTLDWLKNKEKLITEIIAQVNKIEKEKFIPINSDSEEEAKEDITDEPLALMTMEIPEITKACKPYETVSLEAVPYANSESIYFPENRLLICEQLKKIIDQEAPISKNYLFKKLTRNWNTAKIGAKMQAYLSNILDSIPQLETTISHQVFYWSALLKPTDLDYYRDNNLEKRAIDDIAQEELQVAILEIMQVNLSLDKVELVRLTARVFGFMKVGAQIDAVITAAVEDLIVKRKLVVNGDKIITGE